jgi:heme exporter protein D
MNWGSFSDFLAMGGYGLYVWGSYGVTALALAIEVLLLVRRERTPDANAGRSMQSDNGAH